MKTFQIHLINKFMIAILSPAKTLDFETEYHIAFKNIVFLDFKRIVNLLIDQLKKLNVDELSNLMSLSSSLSDLNFKRYQNWTSLILI